MRIVTLGAKQNGPAWDANTCQFVVKEETADTFIGWTLGNYERDPRMEPCVFPKFAWEVKGTECKAGTCSHCGSVLSAVNFTCVRGEYCPGAKQADRRRKANANRTARREALQSAGLKCYRVNGSEVWE